MWDEETKSYHILKEMKNKPVKEKWINTSMNKNYKDNI